MEIRKVINTYSVDKSCDKCFEGFMRPTGVTLMCSPPQYPHKCTKCDNKETYTKAYPCIEYGE